MALRKIFTHDYPALRKVARPVKRFDDRLAELASDMIESMHAGNGIGLAANQVGILKRVFVLNLNDGEGDLVLVNPEIVGQAGEQCELEGCLSLPTLYAHVKRPAKVTVKYQDLQGNFHEMTGEGLKAACICHERDHLDGILFSDRTTKPLLRMLNKDEVPQKG